MSVYLGSDEVGVIVELQQESKLASVLNTQVSEILVGDLTGLTNIKSYGLAYLSNLTKLELPNTLQTIRQYGIAFNDNLASLTIPESVISIYALAFSNCSKLKEITMKSKTPPQLLNSNAFYYTLQTIYIPKGSLNAYSTATNWSLYSSKFVEQEE